MSYTWQNTVVLVTGAAIGIGERVVRILLEESVKYVAVLDISEDAGKLLQDELNHKYGNDKVKFFQCDVTKDDHVVEAFNWVIKNHGYIDVVINNAGIMNDSHRLYKKEIEVNVTALVTLTLKALELMRKDVKGQGGTVINISSIGGLTKKPAMPIYFATKSAVIQFSNCIGHNETFLRTGVRVFSICYGATETSLLSEDKLNSFDKKLDENLVQILKKYPVQSPQQAAYGLVEAYKKAKSGSVWLVTSGKPALDITDKFSAFYESFADYLIES